MKLRAMRALIAATNSASELFILYFGMVFVAALGFSTVEHKSFGDSLWWAVVTSTTTGYGDISPATVPGRLIGATLMLASILFVLPLLISYIASHLMVNKDAWTDAEQEQLKRDVRAIKEHLKISD